MDVFTCTHCNAVPEQVRDSKATIAVVRHKLGCPTLLARLGGLNVEAIDRLDPFG